MVSHHTRGEVGRDSLISRLPGERVTTYPRLCLALRSLILDEVSEDVCEDLLGLSQVVSEVRRRLSFHPVDRKAVFERVAGVDAGSQRVPLASRWFAVVTALVYQLPEARRYFPGPESVKLPYSLSGERFQEVVGLRREAKLFETAAGFLANRGGVDLLLVDGPLAFGNWWANKGEDRDRAALVSSINLLLDLCAEEGVAVAGVVKRATARYLIDYLGLREATQLPDAFILLQTMRPGERTGVFSPGEALRRTVRAAPFMDRISHPIHSFYMRSSPNGLAPPIRVDVPEYMLGRVDELAGHCYATAVRDGVPLALVRADEEARVTKRFVEGVYSELIPRLESRLGAPSLAAAVWGELS